MILQVGFLSNDFTKDLQRILIKDFTMDFTNFYGFVKKMVQKNQYTYNFPPGSSAPASTTRPEGPSLMGRVDGWTGWTGWTVIKSVLQISSYFVGIQIMYTSTCIFDGIQCVTYCVTYCVTCYVTYCMTYLTIKSFPYFFQTLWVYR